MWRSQLQFTARPPAAGSRSSFRGDLSENIIAGSETRRQEDAQVPEPGSPPQVVSPALRGVKRHFGAIAAPPPFESFRLSELSPFSRPAPAAKPDASVGAVSVVNRILIVKEPWVSLLLRGTKTWELRGSVTHVRGRVGFVASGSGRIVGGATLVGCRGPLSAQELRANQDRHCVPLDRAGSAYKETYAWIFKDAQPLAAPLLYRHPKGAIIWVKLPEPALC